MATSSLGRAYFRTHYAARKLIGAACVQCGASPVEAALRPDTPPARIVIDDTTGSPYSLDPNDYVAMCIPCHRRLDHVALKTHCRHGHEYTPANTRLRHGARRCLACHRDEERRRLSNPAKLVAKRELNRRRPPLTAAQRARKTELQRQRRSCR